MDNKQEFDDLVLMQFADNELDSDTRQKLEAALLTDSKLRERLEPFVHSKVDLEVQMNGIPKEIEGIIKKNSKKTRSKKINVMGFLFGGSSFVSGGILQARPAIAIAIAFAVGGLIGASSNLFFTPKTQQQSPVSKILTPMSSESKTSDMGQKIQKPDRIAISIIRNLSKNPNIKTFQTKSGLVKILSSFTGINDSECKVAYHNDKYYIACKSKDGKWSVKN